MEVRDITLEQMKKFCSKRTGCFECPFKDVICWTNPEGYTEEFLSKSVEIE